VSVPANVVRVEVPPRRDHLALVRLVVSGAAAIHRSVPERRLEDLRLAVTEACANAVDATQKAGSSAPVAVLIELQEDLAVVRVIDHAGGFEPAEIEVLPAATDPQRLTHERGLGLSLMRSLVDEVAFARTSDGMEVRLTVRS
jgi:serine/threonine-protein kinase RsbW